MRFKGRAVLVTGGERGIGQAIALGYAREGASVAINAAHLPSAEETRSCSAHIGRTGHRH